MAGEKQLSFRNNCPVVCIFCFTYLHRKKGVANNNKKSKQTFNNTNFWNCFHQLIVNRELLIISLFGFFLGSTSSVITAHFTLFLFLDYNLPKTIAGLGFAIVQFGSIFGRAIWGFLCDGLLKTNKRKTFFYMGILFSFIAVVLSLFLHTLNPSIFTLFLFAFLIGFSGYGWPGLYNAAITETVPEENVGIAIGFASLYAIRNDAGTSCFWLYCRLKRVIQFKLVYLGHVTPSGCNKPIFALKKKYN